MKTVAFLRDIDDWKHYGQLLEVAYAEALCELASILSREHEYSVLELQMDVPEQEVLEKYRDLHRLRVVMALTVRQSVDRGRRLADVARGLSDRVLNEEGSEK